MDGLDARLAALSDAFADLAAMAAPAVVGLRAGGRGWISGVLWRPGLVVTSEQSLDTQEGIVAVLPGGKETPARLAGRDPGTNIAVLRIEGGEGGLRRAGTAPRIGAMTVLAGSDGGGGITARFGLVQMAGPAWHSMAGGRIERLLRLDARLGRQEEGGPVLDAAGGLLGFSTFGPRRRVLVIPHETVDRVLDPLLKEGRVARGWLGLGLHPVEVPAQLREVAGCQAGLMVVSLAPDGPAEQAGVLPGDILLDLDGRNVLHPRAVAELLGPERVGRPCSARLLRAGAVVTLTVTIAARPA
jgi:S1-C subfamily serine protease